MDRIFQDDLLSRRRWAAGDFLQALTFENWLQHPSSLPKFANTATRNRIRSNILGALAGRTFFVTPKKRIGIVQAKKNRVQRGDVIALLVGLHMPAILRRRRYKVDETYEFIAPCYCDGTCLSSLVENVI